MVVLLACTCGMVNIVARLSVCSCRVSADAQSPRPPCSLDCPLSDREHVVEDQLNLNTIKGDLDHELGLRLRLANCRELAADGFAKSVTNKMLPNEFAALDDIKNSQDIHLTLVLNMSTNLQNQDYAYFEVDDDSDSQDSAEESEDVDYPVERIIAEFTCRNGHLWYLVKWKNCPLVRSSWECKALFKEIPWVLDEWKVEKQKQLEGKSDPLDLVAFNRACLELEVAQRQRRRLRSFRKQAQTILEAVTAS